MNRASNTGLMTIRLTRDNRFPAAGVEVQLTDGNKIYNTVTDQNGRASFNVETPPFYTSQIVSPAAQPFTQVNILISAPGYVSVRVVNLMVFPLTETTFTQNMILLAGSPYGSVRTVVIPTHHLARTPLGELPQAPEREAAPIPTVAETDDEGNVYNRRVIVPEYITVHMGPPSSDAQNITVPYLYYLKSVASSEIYPTWPTEALKANSGCGVPTIKPWDMDTIREKFALVQEAEPFAIAMDIDAAGLPFLQGLTPPAGSKSVEELKQIVSWAQRPFILKGIMTARGAEKALEAGASGIVVSNHGGRVLDHCPATAEVLPEIVDAVGGKMTILVDGGIRSGMDIFKALALGADAVLIGRPFVTTVYGGGEEGVQLYVQKLKAELADTMRMCGAHSLAEIKRSMLFGF